MNENLIKNVIKYKLTTAEKILNHLPKEMSSNVKNLSKIILESIKENSQEINDEPMQKAKSSGGINNIKID